MIHRSQISVETQSGNAPSDPAFQAGVTLSKNLRTSWTATSGYGGLTCYVNYAHGDETLEQKYGARKLPRLAALKQKWDPNNVFAFNNAVPSEYP